MNLSIWTTQLDTLGLSYLLNIQLDQPLSQNESILFTCDKPALVLDPVFENRALKFPGTRVSFPLTLSLEAAQHERGEIKFEAKVFSNDHPIVSKSLHIKIGILELQGIPIDMTVRDQWGAANNYIYHGDSCTAIVTVDSTPANLDFAHYIVQGTEDPIDLEIHHPISTSQGSTTILVPINTKFLVNYDSVLVKFTAQGKDTGGNPMCFNHYIVVYRGQNGNWPLPQQDAPGHGHPCP